MREMRFKFMNLAEIKFDSSTAMIMGKQLNLLSLVKMKIGAISKKGYWQFLSKFKMHVIL